MKVIEIIEIRSAVAARDRVLAAIADMRQELDNGPEDTETRLYVRTGVRSDVAVHLHHHKPVSSARGSRMALHIVEALKEYALVHLSLWIELDTENGPADPNEGGRL